jgi:5,6,7,8-tetrahydromethanopterin hydro-lyase
MAIDRSLVGEALVGDGNEVAHIDLIIGPRGGAAENAFLITLTNQKEGVNGLLAVLTPNLMVKPATVLFNSIR